MSGKQIDIGENDFKIRVREIQNGFLVIYNGNQVYCEKTDNAIELLFESFQGWVSLNG